MIAAVILLPLGLALLMLTAHRARPIVSRAIPAVALPAAAAGTLGRGGSLELDGLLLGVRLAVDETAAVFLMLSAVVWSLSAVYARSYLDHDTRRHRFEIFFLATMASQLGLSMARDAVSFYLFFWSMTLAAYGLVVHDDTARARRAGRVYLVMAILGEGLLLPAVLVGVAEAGTAELASVALALRDAPHGAVAMACIVLGFAVKVGLPPLHFWLPLAHPAAPVPASAVLSGLLIKAGLLGWLRFLPVGSVELPQLGSVLVVLGTVAALAGAVVGMLQHEAKSALAYSSVSQMGWMSLVVGLGLQTSPSWATLSPLLLLFVVHHGLAKSALFLGVDAAHATRAPRIVIVLGLMLPALALVGAPFTLGAGLKAVIKSVALEAPAPFAVGLPRALQLATFATALVLARAIHLILRDDAAHAGEPRPHSRARLASWLLLVALGALLPVIRPVEFVSSTASVPAIAVAALATGLGTRLRWTLPVIPPGDLLNAWPWTFRARAPAAPRAARSWSVGAAWGRRLADAESRLAEGVWLALAYGGIAAVLAIAAWKSP